MANSSTARSSTDSAVRALAASPRLPASSQRRLSRLMDKSRESSLSKKERAELESMLEDIDRKSFWMLARVLVQNYSAEEHHFTTLSH
ncbi:MAG TPA: hypothetical protein VFC78_09980 [Tepidisphaeraceae bacterium]|nr:hypothetical protein [Tepidisphaeraceae bacterium]